MTLSALGKKKLIVFCIAAVVIFFIVFITYNQTDILVVDKTTQNDNGIIHYYITDEKGRTWETSSAVYGFLYKGEFVSIWYKSNWIHKASNGNTEVEKYDYGHII